MSSCLGLYIENNIIKYAKVSKDHDNLKIDAFGIKFYEKLGDSIDQVVEETYSQKTPISVNMSEEMYNYFNMYALLTKSDLQKAIRTEFEALKNDFETIRQQIEDDVVRTELYKGEFYELTPYSYQRNGCKQGKPVKRPDTIKSTKNLCIYGFNNQNQIVEVKVGCSIENQFYHTFLYYTDNLVKSILYDNGKHLMNVCHYFFEGGKLKRSQLCGRYGCREENYIYKENALTHIEVKQYDIEGNSGNDLIHIFQYQDDGALESITKSFPNGYSEIIYKTKRGC